MTDADDMKRFVSTTVEHYGRKDVAALSADHLPRGPLLDLTAGDWRAVFFYSLGPSVAFSTGSSGESFTLLPASSSFLSCP